MKRKQGKTILSLTVAAMMAAACPISVLAASPEFAYDEATWARLRDNVMEYDELAMLVQEYNPTYLNNLASYQDGKTSEDAREVRDKQYESAYDAYDSADNLREQADDLEESGALASEEMRAVYLGLMSSAAMMEQTALKTEQSADSSYRDSEMDTLDYRNGQNAIIVQTQGLFASYNQVRATMDTIAENIETARANVDAVQRQVQLGMATQTDFLNAQKNLQSLESTQTQTAANLESLRQQLCLMTGWQYNDQPDIKELPAADQSRIAAMNPDADVQTALNENLSLKSNRRAYENMQEGSADKKNMERTIKNQEESIKAGVRNLYNDVLQKQTALLLAQTALDTETAAMNAAETKYQLGMISKMEYLQEKAAFTGKQSEAQTADMSLQQSIELYEWALKGYMSL